MSNNKLSLIFDIDNTLISSLTMKEVKKLKHIPQLKYHDMDNYYRIYHRPYLQELLDFAFKHFNVSIFTAASQSYAFFIIENIFLKDLDYDTDYKMINKPKRDFKMVLYDDNCEESRKYFNPDTPKDLKYVYQFPGYNPCNTIIVDDLKEVYEANPKNTIRADYFDSSKKDAHNDNFLLRTMLRLKEIKKEYDSKGCMQSKN